MEPESVQLEGDMAEGPRQVDSTEEAAGVPDDELRHGSLDAGRGQDPEKLGFDQAVQCAEVVEETAQSYDASNASALRRQIALEASDCD